MPKVCITVALAALLTIALLPIRVANAVRGESPKPPPEELPAGALQDASSVYLRQAAAQPIRWQPYNDDSFALAKRMNRPVLLDIGAMWCHWCHVMDEGTYSDPDVAQLINQLVVPIKVDRDQRPDVDQYYQAAAAELSGNGGWPLTCFTLPDGTLIAAFGFLPPHQGSNREAPAMDTVVTEVAKAYKVQRKDLETQATALSDKLKKSSEPKVLTEGKPALAPTAASASGKDLSFTSSRRWSSPWRRVSMAIPILPGWRPKPCARWRAAGFMISSAAGSIAIPPISPGRSRISRRCPTTRRWRCPPTRTPTR
jgi:thiol-disulfide isomerase/thioredoxin